MENECNSEIENWNTAYRVDVFVGENPWELKMIEDDLSMCQRGRLIGNSMRQTGQLIFPWSNQEWMQEGWNSWKQSPKGWIKSPLVNCWMQMGHWVWEGVVWSSWKGFTGGKTLTARLAMWVLGVKSVRCQGAIPPLAFTKLTFLVVCGREVCAAPDSMSLPFSLFSSSSSWSANITHTIQYHTNNNTSRQLKNRTASLGRVQRSMDIGDSKNSGYNIKTNQGRWWTIVRYTLGLCSFINPKRLQFIISFLYL